MKKFWSVMNCVLTFALLAYCGVRVIFDCGYRAIPVGLLMVISFPLCTVLHELGHMLFGATVKIKAVPDAPSFGGFLKQTLLEWGGSSSCKLIPGTDKNLKSRIIFTTLGGLAVNFVFIILGVLALSVPAIPTDLCALMPASYYLFSLNAVPLTLDGGKTDGLIFLELINDADTAKVMLAVLTVQAQKLNGQPVDEKLLFDVPQIQEDDLNFIALTQLRYEYFKEKGDEEQAEKYALRLEDLKQYIT